MSQADFYVLTDTHNDSRYTFLCRLADKVLGKGRQVFISVASEQEAERLDQLLWDYRPEAFIPHGIISNASSAADTPAPVQIGWGDTLPEHRDVFINLHLDTAGETLKFERILEIVVQQDDILTATRKNYATYKDAGIEIKMHDMRPKS